MSVDRERCFCSVYLYQFHSNSVCFCSLFSEYFPNYHLYTIEPRNIPSRFAINGPKSSLPKGAQSTKGLWEDPSVIVRKSDRLRPLEALRRAPLDRLV